MLRFLRESLYARLFLIVLAGLAAYSNTFNVPFQWDEDFFIKGNPIVKDLSFFAEPSKAMGLEQYGAFKSRYIGYLTFALNYKLHGLDVRGYHIFNMAMHLLSSILVYFLISLTLKTPLMKGSSSGERFRFIPLFTGLLFVSHPVQTEAVTYIFQRLGSLAAFFYLLATVFYAKWRLGNEKHSTGSGCKVSLSNNAPYLFSILSAALAMETKENAFTLPFSIALYELLFFTGNPWKRLLPVTPFLLIALVIPLSLVGYEKPVWDALAQMPSATRHYTEISSTSYLITQFRVIATYIGLLLLPIGQNINYDYPVYNSFFEPPVLASFLLLLSLIGAGVYLLYRSRKYPALRLIAWGIFWFFLTLSVESSLIPIPVIICEYRLYLPSPGFFL